MLSWGGRDVGFGDSCSDPARVCWWEGDQGDRAGFAYIAEGDPQGDPGAGRRVRLSAQGSAAAADRSGPGQSRYEIGSAWCRGRGCQIVGFSVGAGESKTKHKLIQ